MPELQRHTLVRCPLGQASTQLRRFLSERGDRSDVVRLALRAAVHLPALETDIALERDVVVTIARPNRRSAPRSEAASFRVEWAPADGGLFPRFHGTLAARKHEDAEAFSLVLRGTYQVPAGFAADRFDAGIGHRIAQATARDLLLEVRGHIEASLPVSGGATSGATTAALERENVR